MTRYGFTPSPNGTIATTFTAPVAISANALVVKNGSILTAGVDYSYSADQVTFFIAPNSTDILALYE